MTHQQARETVPLLLTDANTDVSIRAMRAAGRQKNEDGIDKLSQLLKQKESPPLLAAEALGALIAIDSDKARASVAAYKSANPADVPHRASKAVESVFSAGTRR
jgi:HEAT repeat protein